MIGDRSFLTATADTGGVTGIDYRYAIPVDMLGLIAYAGYLIGAVISVTGCYAAVSAVLRLRADPLRTRTLRLLARLGPLITLGACMAGVSAASRNDFAHGAVTVASAAFAAGATAVVGLAIVRLLSFHAHPVP